MTLHVVYDHECGGCGAFYIPYDTDVPCPRCGVVEDERFDYIPRAVESVQFNKRSYGSYRPMAWWVGSLGDHILHVLFGILDAYEEKGAGQDFADFADSAVAEMDWGDQDYLKIHVRDIAIRIHGALGAPGAEA